MTHPTVPEQIASTIGQLGWRSSVPEQKPVEVRLEEVDAWWSALPRQHSCPARGAVDPEDLLATCPQSFLATYIAPNLLKLRHVGEEAGAGFCPEPRGLPLNSFFDAKSRGTLSQMIERVRTQPAIVDLPLTYSGTREHARDGHLRLWPLLSDRGDVTDVIGALVFDGKVRSMALEALRIKETKPASVEKLPPIVIRPKTERRAKPHLVLVVDNS